MGIATVQLPEHADAERYSVAPMMVLLCSITFTEGADAALFPSVTKALENLEDFNVTWLGYLATTQMLFQATAGPLWGIAASRGIMTRKRILTLGTFFQGFATLLMWMNLDITVMCSLRAINGSMLAALRPIAISIVADRFDDSVRGRYFSFLMMGLNLGAAFCSIFATTISERLIFGESFWGWQLSFVTVGLLSMALAPLIHFFLDAPPVKVEASSGKVGIGSELQALRRLFSQWTFTGLVIQGCIGAIPWRAFDFRTFFFESANLSKLEAGILSASGGLACSFGVVVGGLVGDALAKCWPLHGRILTAEISVFGGIPLAYLTFLYLPEGNHFWYYFALTVGLSLVACWTPAGCNAPVLCTIAKENERSLVLAWQSSLEGAVGAMGPLLFSVLLGNVFGYDPECSSHPDRPDCADTNSAGRALFWTSCLPWLLCGLTYTSLHYSYPRDLEALQARDAGSESNSRCESETESETASSSMED